MIGRGVRVGLWLGWVAVCTVIVVRASYTTDLSAFLPAAPTENQQLLVDQLRSGPVSRLLLLAIESTAPAGSPTFTESRPPVRSPPPTETTDIATSIRAAGSEGSRPDDAAERARLSKALTAALTGAPGISAITNGAIATSDDPAASLLFDYRYLLGDAVEAGRLAMPGLGAALRDGLDILASPLGLVYRSVFTRDPTVETLRLVDRMQPATTPRVIDGVWASDDGKRAILLVRLDADGTQLDGQQAALAVITTAFDEVRGTAPARLVMTGTARFAVESRDGIERDVRWLSLLGTAAIVLLLSSVYRSPRPLLLGLLPVATGALSAVAAVALVFGEVHAITLGFGVALIGEGIDYAVYLFVQGSTPTLWRTVRLGVLTSLIGFSSLLASSFPGLAQLGVFAVTGILVAALVTRFVLAPFVGAHPVALPPWLVALARRLPMLRRFSAVPVVASLIAAVTIVVMAQQRPLWQADLGSLSPISAADQQLDQELRGALRAPDVRHVIAVSAPDDDGALALAARVADRLAPLITEGILGGVQSPATWLPPTAVQRARLEALPDRETLGRAVAEATAGLAIRADRLAPFIDDVVASREREPLTVAALGSSDLSLAVTSLMMTTPIGVTAMLPLQAPGPDGMIDIGRVAERLTGTSPLLADGTVGKIHLLDLKAETDGLYGAYLRQALALSTIGACLIVMTLAVALGRRDPAALGAPGPAPVQSGLIDIGRFARVVGPLVAAELSVMAVLVASGTALTILHLVGMLLIVAVGSNYTLFFADRDDDERVLASVLLANVTTATGFGVLGFADAPVLAAIGQTVGPGAVLSLVYGAMASRA